MWRTTMLYLPRPRRMSFSLAACVVSRNSLLLGRVHLEAALMEWKNRNPCHYGSCESLAPNAGTTVKKDPPLRLTLSRRGSAPDNLAFVIPKVAGYSGMSRDCILLLLRGMKNVGCPSFKTPGWMNDAIGDRTLRVRMLLVDDLGSSFVSQLVSWVKSVWPQVDVRVQHTYPSPARSCVWIHCC